MRKLGLKTAERRAFMNYVSGSNHAGAAPAAASISATKVRFRPATRIGRSGFDQPPRRVNGQKRRHESCSPHIVRRRGRPLEEVRP